MVRAEWLNLNGAWDFAETDDAETSEQFLTTAAWPDQIIVPFCRESKLSGLERVGFVKNVWYRRNFNVPADWKSPRVLLHVGACDWKTRVWVNGQLVGQHKGGSAPFAFDITRALKKDGNTVIVHAFDDTASGLQATGKQSHELKSNGCVYTRTTGIWQTVWLEGVGETFIKDYFVTPDITEGKVSLRVDVSGPQDGVRIAATAFANGKEVGSGVCSAEGRAGELVIALSEKRLWSLDDPFLYDLKLKVTRGDQVLDTLDSYFGLRGVSIEGAAYLINGKPVFQRLVLDQGFYPDGIWTAPTEEALKHDIELSKAAGFNGARFHQKVFEPRSLYWADKLGYLVWGEFNSWGPNIGKPGVDLPIVNEWTEVVRRDRNHPCIIGWCPFNETDANVGEIQNTIVNATREIDPTRPVLDTSGYVHSLADPEVLDTHDYDQDPETFRQRYMNMLGGCSLPPQYVRGAPTAFVPYFVSEYGGIGWNIEKGWGYGNIPKTLDEFYQRYEGLTNALLDNPHMFGFCYTQLTNIEQEQNGIYLYDRTPKFDIERIRAINARAAAYESAPPLKAQEPVAWKVVLGAFPDAALAHPWRYTVKDPGDAWTQPGFDDGAWKTGLGGFGEKKGWEAKTRTKWDTSDIWLRQQFEFDGTNFEKAMLAAHYDNGTEVYVNGKPVWSGTGWNDNYAGFEITDALKQALQKGANTIAVHCHQDSGGQFIDVALLVR
jgi:hypothetical protein